MLDSSFKYEDLKKVAQQIKEITDILHPISQPNNFFDIRILEVEPMFVPKIKIRDDFKWCSDGFRREMNNWLKEMFGVVDKSAVPKGKGYLIANEFFIMRVDDRHSVSTKLCAT